jgi:hypothetical protein
MLAVERGTRDRADTDDGRLGRRRDARQTPKGRRFEMEEGTEERWNVGERIQLESAFPPSI